MTARALAVVALVAAAPLCGCGAGGPFAVRVTSFEAGGGAGFGQDALPDVVLGPPHGGPSTREAGQDVLSLGQGGAIVLELGVDLVDDDGDDLAVFENPFEFTCPAGTCVFSELGEVAVSEDGEAFTAFACDVDSGASCAGLAPVLASDDVDQAGGDRFDLAAIGVSRARFVRITDRGTSSAAPSAGFDLDAIAALHDL